MFNPLISFNPFLGIEDGVLKLLLLIDAKLFGLISKLYGLYVDLAQAKIFKDNVFQDIVLKLYTIMGVVALFVIAYALLQNLINPDNASKSDKSYAGIIKNLLIAIVLIGLIPTIFDFLYGFQNSILSFNTIPKLFFGESNTTTETVYYQDSSGNYIYTDDCEAESLEEAEKTCTKLTTTVTVDESSSLLKSYGNEMAYIILSGFINPADGYTSDDIEVDASDYFNTGTALGWAGGLCLVGGGIATGVVVALEIATSPATGFATLAAVPGTIAAFGGTIAATCIGGAALGLTINGVGYVITARNYKWSDAEMEMIYNGDFDRITAFSGEILDGRMDYLPVVSTICGLLLLYMMASFCLDLGVRAAKLVFYEIFAPITLLLGVIPAQKNLTTNWIKAVLTTWAEVFIRILCVCGLAYLVSNLNNTAFGELGLLAKAIIVMGLVAFAKQLPKLIGDLTGIKSDGMKLGIMEKLKDGGALVAGSIIGGGISTGARNLTSGIRNIRNKWKEDTKNGVDAKTKGKNVAKGIGKSVLSTVAGTFSGGARSGKKGWNAKNFSDMKKSASEGANEAVEARINRANYKASKSAGKGFIDDLGRVALGHIGDTASKVGSWAGIKNIAELKAENEAMELITNTRDNFDQVVEELILKEISKGAHDIAGINILNVARLKEALENKRANGTATIADETAYNNALIEARLKLENLTSVSTDHWNKYTEAVQAKLSKARVEAVKYKGAIRNHADLDALKVAGIIGADFADSEDVKIGERKADGRWDDVDTIDKMNKRIKIDKGRNNVTITTLEQEKTNDKEKK